MNFKNITTNCGCGFCITEKRNTFLYNTSDLVEIRSLLGDSEVFIGMTLKIDNSTYKIVNIALNVRKDNEVEFDDYVGTPNPYAVIIYIDVEKVS